MKYLILENHFSYSIALDEAGRFIKVANMNYEIGQTVDEIYPIENKKSNSPNLKKLTILVSSLAACFVLLFTTLFTQPPIMYASIYMTINPELRIDVSKEGKVVEIEPINKDGEILIKDYKWKNKDLNEVSKELTKRSIDLGYLKKDGKITIGIDSPNNKWYEETSSNLRNLLDNFISKDLAILIEINKYGETKEEATDSTILETETTEEPVEIKPTTPTPAKINNTKPNTVTPVAKPPISDSSDDDDYDDDYDDDDDDDTYEDNYNDDDDDYDDDDDDYDDDDDD